MVMVGNEDRVNNADFDDVPVPDEVRDIVAVREEDIVPEAVRDVVKEGKAVRVKVATLLSTPLALGVFDRTGVRVPVADELLDTDRKDERVDVPVTVDERVTVEEYVTIALTVLLNVDFVLSVICDDALADFDEYAVADVVAVDLLVNVDLAVYVVVAVGNTCCATASCRCRRWVVVS